MTLWRGLLFQECRVRAGALAENRARRKGIPSLNIITLKQHCTLGSGYHFSLFNAIDRSLSEKRQLHYLFVSESPVHAIMMIDLSTSVHIFISRLVSQITPRSRRNIWFC